MLNQESHTERHGDLPHFEESGVYFSTYFADNHLLFPFIGSFVYLGMNLLGSEAETTWYFQDCESFAKYGSFQDRTKADQQVLKLTSDTVSHMVTLDDLIPELRRAEIRRATRLQSTRHMGRY